jgi:hypothetical protein
MMPPTRRATFEDTDITGNNLGRCSAFARSSHYTATLKNVRQEVGAKHALQLAATADGPPWQFMLWCSSPCPHNLGATALTSAGPPPPELQPGHHMPDMHVSACHPTTIDAAASHMDSALAFSCT